MLIKCKLEVDNHKTVNIKVKMNIGTFELGQHFGTNDKTL